MHSIVIHFGKKYEDWHLLEPFFYHAIQSKELNFFWEEEASASPSRLGTIVETIIKHLERNRIQIWQLICIVNSSDERSQKLRLASVVNELHHQCFYLLEKGGSSPQQILLYLLDTVSRDADYSPIDPLLKMYWQLDNYGYIKTQASGSGNSFTSEEIKQFNTVWGEEVNLHQAGVWDNPNEEFLLKLHSKCNDVVTLLDHLVAKKKKQLNQKQGWAMDDNWISIDQLTRVQEDFNASINQLKTPPLTSALVGFKPANILVDLLRVHISLYSEIGEIRLVRQELVTLSNHLRLKGYIELAYFLLTILYHPKIIDRMSKGSTSFVQIQVNYELLQQLLTNYYLSLVTEKQLIENQLMLGTHFHTNRFKKADLPPNMVESLEKVEVGLFTEEKINLNHTFFEKWEGVLFRIESKLDDRQKALVRSSKEAVQKLMILKRNKSFITEEDIVEINEYLDELQMEIGKVQYEVMNEVPSVSGAINKWRKTINEKKNEMQSLVKSIPNDSQLSIAFVIAVVMTLVPFFFPLQWQNFTTFEVVYHYLMIPLFVVVWLGVGVYFTKKKARRPIYELYQDSMTLASEQFHLQEESQQKYNEYLHHLYQLFMLRQQFQMVYEKGESQKSQNMLLRYHQLKLQEFVQNAQRLIHVLQLNITQPSDKPLPYTSKINVEKDCLSNTIYSPFDLRGANPQDGGHRIDIFVGSAREHYVPGYMNELEKIRISEDKVYKL